MFFPLDRFFYIKVSRPEHFHIGLNGSSAQLVPLRETFAVAICATFYGSAAKLVPLRETRFAWAEALRALPTCRMLSQIRP